MYIATIYNGTGEYDDATGAEILASQEIHGYDEKVKTGKIVQGINAIDSFTFSLLPSNVGFDKIYDLQTRISVYNTNENKYEFWGRALYSESSMGTGGEISLDVTCESNAGFLCDSEQEYCAKQKWYLKDLLDRVISTHNSQVEDYKQITYGYTLDIDMSNKNDVFAIARDFEIARTDTWSTLVNITNTYGGEIEIQSDETGILQLHYKKRIGKTETATDLPEITLSENMKSISKEKDPTSIVTRIKPLGKKFGDDEDSRFTLVDGGYDSLYIIDEEAKAIYGLKTKTVIFDTAVTGPYLYMVGEEWLKNNNKVKVKYSATALDLSLIDKDFHTFGIGDSCLLNNPLLNIRDYTRIIKKSIDICEEIKSTIEFGDKLENSTQKQISSVSNVKTSIELSGSGNSGGSGRDGKSAYEIAVDNGFEGTEEEWLESLKGEAGPQGPQGPSGKDGYTPIKGTDYFTEEDKEEIVQDTLDCMDLWEGGSY